MCFTRPCARTCAPATTVAVGRLGRRPRQAWTKVFSESPSQTSLEMYHRRRHRVTPGRGASLGARARSEAIWVLLARKKCLKMQMKCFLPEPRFPLEPCTVANGAGTAAMRERRQLRLPGAWFNWWRSSSFHRQWASMRAASTWTVVVVLPDARHHRQRSGCAVRSFERALPVSARRIVASACSAHQRRPSTASHNNRTTHLRHWFSARMGSGGLQMLAREALDSHSCYFRCVAHAL